MRLNPYAFDRTPREFFEDLSVEDFDCQLEIEPFGRDFRVTEYSKFFFLNPIRMMYSPVSDEKKLELAKNLNGMVKKYAGSVVELDTCNVEVINANLSQMAKNMVRNASPDNVKAIETPIQEAINTLASAKFNQRSWFFAQNRVGFKPDDALDPDQFYTELSNSGWFGFNKRIHVKETRPGNFEIYTSAKPRFYNVFAEQVTAAEKVAVAGNLDKMIEADQNFIIEKGYNVAGMVQNLEAMKKNLTRPSSGEEEMTPAQKEMIEKSMARAIESLKEDEKLISTEREKDLDRVIERFVMDWLVRFPYNWGVKPAFNHVVAPIAKGAWNISINKLVKPVLRMSWNVSINRIVKPSLRVSLSAIANRLRAIGIMAK